LREAGNGPVVTAGSVVSGLERMFMTYPPVNFCFVIPSLREAVIARSACDEAIQLFSPGRSWIASLRSQ
jgi:hypothetical protein